MARATVEEKKIVNCLKNKTVEVRFVPKANSRILDPKHVMYGDMGENAKITLSVPRLQSGRYVNVLTDAEKAFFEDKFQFPEGAMSVYNKTDNYWNDNSSNHINTVTLSKRSLFLNLSDPEDYIRYKILLANKSIVAPSLAVLKSAPLPTYQFVLVEKDEETNMAKENLNANMKAFMTLGEIKDNFDKLRFIVETLMKSQVTNDTSIEFLQTKAQEFILKNAKQFLETVRDPLLDNKILLRNGIKNGTITMRGKYLYLTDGNVPLCSANEEPTLEVAAQFLNVPKNQEIKFIIEAKQ